MKNCGALSKYMQSKGMKAIQTGGEEVENEGQEETLSDKDVRGSTPDLKDREGSKSHKATKHLDRYQKISKK